MTDDASAVGARAAAVLEAGGVLRAATLEERADWLAEAAVTLSHEARDGRETLSVATGLSPPMFEWAARTSLATIRRETMLALGQEARDGDPIGMLAVVLAGNVFTASVRGIVVPLLLGVPVLVKASSREASFPAMLRGALRRIDSHLGSSMDVVNFSGGDIECEAALVKWAEAVSVYGSDETVAAIAARLGDTPLIAHGHGVSVAYCGADALAEARIGDTIADLSLDICAYDQRGCLSPQLVYIEETTPRAAEHFAKRLADKGLGPISKTLPRGPLPVSIGGAQAQWRGIAEVEGTLIGGDDYAVAILQPQPMRWSPGFRNVTLVPVRGLDEAMRAMEPIGSNLKCVGADSVSLPKIQARLAASPLLSAYACTTGTMQTPSLNAPADGRPIWHGLIRT